MRARDQRDRSCVDVVKESSEGCWCMSVRSYKTADAAKNAVLEVLQECPDRTGDMIS